MITDTVYGFAVVAASGRLKMFVVPDPDFTTMLNDPASHGVRYLLGAANRTRPVRRTQPALPMTLYETGADVATLETKVPNDGDSQPDWQL